MAKRKNKRQTGRKIVMLNILLAVFLLMGIAYSVLGTTLNMTGNVTVKEHSLKLYDVLKAAAEEGIYAKRFTESHQDSIDSSLSTEEIYHWYQPAYKDYLNEIKSRYNVIFANQCWIMFRTTDTGGTKLIYNGEAQNGQCLDTRGNHLGYNSSSLSTSTLRTDYYYGTDFSYDASANTFLLAGNITTGEIKTGQYTCLKKNAEDACTALYYVYRENETKYELLRIVNNVPMYLIGDSEFNTIETPAAAGYMYNKYYTGASSDSFINNAHILYDYSITEGTKYYYGDKYVKDGSYYFLENDDGSIPEQIEWSSNLEENRAMEGKFTCRSTSTEEVNHNGNMVPQGTRCYWPYYVIDSTTYEDKQLTLMITNTNIIPDATMFFGEDVIDNEDGTYSLVGVSEISRSEWYTNYSDYRHHYYCSNYRNTTCEKKNINYIVSSSKNAVSYESFSRDYKYSKSVTYDYETGEYTLTGDSITFWDFTNQEQIDIYHTMHYTCLNDTGVCKTVKYIYGDYLDTTKYFSYMNLNDGVTGDNIIDEMLRAEDVNKYDSTVKIYIDSWYERTLLNYSDYLEDTIFCNNRELWSKEGWDPNNNIGSIFVYFRWKDNLDCYSELDSFSVGNPKAQLKYKIGLLTNKEVSLMNNQRLYFDNTNRYWLGTIDFITDDATIELGPGGTTNNIGTSGVRPTISLKKGTKYTSGTGSQEDPYIVDAPPITG